MALVATDPRFVVHPTVLHGLSEQGELRFNPHAGLTRGNQTMNTLPLPLVLAQFGDVCK